MRTIFYMRYCRKWSKKAFNPCGVADVNMGKRKHGFNWKARQQKETNVDRSAEKKVSCQRLKSLICKHNNVETEVCS